MSMCVLYFEESFLCLNINSFHLIFKKACVVVFAYTYGEHITFLYYSRGWQCAWQGWQWWMPPFQENGKNVGIFATKAKEHLPAIFDIQQIIAFNLFHKHVYC